MFVVCRKQCQSTTLLRISYNLVQYKHYTSFVEQLVTNDKSNNYVHVMISNSTENNVSPQLYYVYPILWYNINITLHL